MQKVKICSSINIKQYNDFKKKITSSVVSKGDYIDYVAEGYKPNFGWLDNPDAFKTGKIGVLAHYDNEPIAYLDRPTINLMLFTRKWAEDCLLNNLLVQAALDLGVYYMSDFHRDSDCVDYPDVAGRITSQRISDDGKFVVGSFDILDTVLGRNVYLLSKTGPIGTSTRGWGALGQPDKNGVRLVVPEEYTHVCSDFVTFPAVPNAFVDPTGTASSDNLDNLYDELGSYVDHANTVNPNDSGLRLFSSVMKQNRTREEYQEVLNRMKRRRLEAILKK